MSLIAEAEAEAEFRCAQSAKINCYAHELNAKCWHFKHFKKSIIIIVVIIIAIIAIIINKRKSVICIPTMAASVSQTFAVSEIMER